MLLSSLTLLSLVVLKKSMEVVVEDIYVLFICLFNFILPSTPIAGIFRVIF